nr:MAG TPA: hypothetical protein [Caudoviricetes sp.]
MFAQLSSNFLSIFFHLQFSYTYKLLHLLDITKTQILLFPLFP